MISLTYRCLSDRDTATEKKEEVVEKPVEVVPCRQAESDVISGVMANVLRYVSNDNIIL